MSSISPSEAREALPVLSMGNIRAALRRSLTDEEVVLQSQVDLLYLHYLICRGDFPNVRDFLESFPDAERCTLVNATDYHTHFGNTLHTCAYWNTGEAALEMFAYLVECGAQPIRNSYMNLPWEQNAILYVSVVPGDSVTQARNPDDFVDTYTLLRNLYEEHVDPAIRVYT